MQNVEWIPNNEKLFGIIPKFWNKQKAVPLDELEKKAPFLLLIHEDKTVKVIGNVRSGRLVFDSKDGKDDKEGENKARRSILIDEKKRLYLKYGEDEIPIYVAYVNEAVCYPHDVRRDSNALYLFYQKIMLESKLLNEGGGTSWFAEFFKKYGIIIMFALGALYFAYNAGMLDQWIKPAAQTVANNVTAAVNTGVIGETPILEGTAVIG